jgi:hypothetical protein
MPLRDQHISRYRRLGLQVEEYSGVISFSDDRFDIKFLSDAKQTRQRVEIFVRIVVRFEQVWTGRAELDTQASACLCCEQQHEP